MFCNKFSSLKKNTTGANIYKIPKKVYVKIIIFYTNYKLN